MKETRQPQSARPGAPACYDYEYERNGVSNLFMLFAPLEGWRRVEVTDQRTKVDWARVVRQLVDVDYPDKDWIVLVMDNLNTHHPASLYEAFEPAEARRIAERLEIHYTPKHGSWLNMAEMELAALTRQCLDRRIPSQDILKTGNSGLARTTKRRRSSCRLAFHHRGRPNQAQVPVSLNPTLMAYKYSVNLVLRIIRGRGQLGYPVWRKALMAGVTVMVRDKYAVRLAAEQREELRHLIRVGKSPARVTARARILLKSDDGWPAPQVAEGPGCSPEHRIPDQAVLRRRGVGGGFAGPSPSQPAPEAGRPGRSSPDRPGLHPAAGRA